MYSYGPPHMAEQKQDNQLKHTYSSSVRIWDVALKSCQRQWTIGRSGERGSGISMLTAWHDDDDEFIYFRGVTSYDVQSFTTEIWLIKYTLIQLHLKHWKFEMNSYNLLLKNRNYIWLSPTDTWNTWNHIIVCKLLVLNWNVIKPKKQKKVYIFILKNGVEVYHKMIWKKKKKNPFLTRF